MPADILINYSLLLLGQYQVQYLPDLMLRRLFQGHISNLNHWKQLH